MTAGIAALSPSVQRMPGEDFTSYFLRLFDNRLTYGLTCSQVADLLNAESGQPEYSESKWRKDYKSVRETTSERTTAGECSPIRQRRWKRRAFNFRTSVRHLTD